ncbi:MAG: hypothetical protein QXP42_03795 [Candidatus Micrarchaeia archaeon]
MVKKCPLCMGAVRSWEYYCGRCGLFSGYRKYCLMCSASVGIDEDMCPRCGNPYFQQPFVLGLSENDLHTIACMIRKEINRLKNNDANGNLKFLGISVFHELYARIEHGEYTLEDLIASFRIIRDYVQKVKCRKTEEKYESMAMKIANYTTNFLMN